MTIYKRATIAAIGGVSFTVFFQLPSAFAQEDVLKGVFALPDGEEAVSGEMTLNVTGPLSREMKLVYKDKTTGEQISDYEVELTQELHILATDAQLSTLVHQHVESAGDDGTFSTTFNFPAPGLYHIYTDAVPSGDYGQQVLRFDVNVGDVAAAASLTASEPTESGSHTDVLESSNDNYTVRLDVAELRAEQESAVKISVEKDGEPAGDLTPYLGVAAHAVFVRAADLAYVHAHASDESVSQSDNGSHNAAAEGADSHHTAPSAETAPPHAAHGGHTAPRADSAGNHATPGHDAGGHDVVGHGAGHSDHGALASSTPISAEMDLFVTPPAPGTYALWIEFMGGGEVQTIPFKLEVPPKN